MKKALAIILAVMFIVCTLSVASFATDYRNLEIDGKLFNFSGMDFNEENNIWAKYDETEGKWVSSGLKGYNYTDYDSTSVYVIVDEENDIYSVYDETTGKFTEMTGDDFYADDFYGSLMPIPATTSILDLNTINSYIKKLDWSLSDDGEFITLISNSSSSTPGIFLTVDEEMSDLEVNSAENGCAEYVSIRLRNKSSASKCSFAFITSNTNGGQAFMSRTQTDFDITPNSGEWVTYTFSMVELNSAMGAHDNGGHGWAGYIRSFAVFPFGCDFTDGTGAYESAEMDIDYIVIGSEEYCKNYKSELQKLEESVKSIELVSAPTKTTYYVGDTIDLTGLKIKATYNDGTSEVISDCSVSYDFSNASDSTAVTLKYGTSTTPLTYNVKVVGIDSIEVSGQPETTTYEVADVASGITTDLISGLTIKINYLDGTSKDGVVPSVKNLSLSDTAMGEQVVTINYYGAQTSYNVNVINVVELKIADLEKGLYYNGKITTDDLTITVKYSDGTEKDIDDADLSDYLGDIEYDTTVFGDITIKTTLKNETYDIDLSASAKATVLAPASIEIESAPTKTTYTPDDRLDTTGLVVNFVYSDGKKVAVLPEDYKTTYDFSEPGTRKVTVTANNLTATFDVTVEGAKVPTGTTATTSDNTSSGGCSSVIGTGAFAVLAVATAAGVIVCKKKEN